jgi:hypothetical protein
MNADKDSIPQTESRCPMHAAETQGEYAGDISHGKLLRASDVERGLPASAPLAIILQWVRDFLARPHPDVGRAGPVCPFTPTALALDTIWLTEVDDPAPDRAGIVELISRYRDLFLEIEPRVGSAALNKTILVVFPQLGSDAAPMLDDVQAELKASFVELGLMLGEFHSENESPGLRNPEFRPLRSPVPMLAIRHMVESDLPFLRRTLDEPSIRASYLRSYLRRLGSTVRAKYLDQAVTALADAIHATAKSKRVAAPPMPAPLPASTKPTSTKEPVVDDTAE